jgi:hypothetical protein
LTGRGADAKLEVINGKPNLLAGSRIITEKGPSCPKAIAAKRDEYLANGVLMEREGYLVTTQDIEFGSTSAAAAFVLGTSASGPAEWKPEVGGQPIKSAERPPAEKPKVDVIWRPASDPEKPSTGAPSFPRIMAYEKNQRIVDRTTEALKELPATHLDALAQVRFHDGMIVTATDVGGKPHECIGTHNYGTNILTVADYYGHRSLGLLHDTVWHEAGHSVHSSVSFCAA